MARSTSYIRCANKACENTIEIALSWTPGGMNDYGGFILQCGKCSTVFPQYIGRDISDSRVQAGGKSLDSWDKGVPGHQEQVYERHGFKMPAAE